MILSTNSIWQLVFAMRYDLFTYLGKIHASECLNSYAVGATNSSNYEGMRASLF